MRNRFEPSRVQHVQGLHDRVGFQAEVRAQVDAYFAERSLSRHADAAAVVEIAAWLSAALLLYVGVVSGVLPGVLVLVLGLVHAQIGFNVGHDAIHRATSRHGWVNTVLGWSFDLLGGSSYAWQRAHNVVHHTFTNVPGVDRDIDGAPFMMFYAHERVPRYYRWQHVFAFLYYPLTMLAWTFVKDFVELARGDVSATHWRGWAGMLLGKVAHVGVYLVVPLLVYPGPWWVVILGYLAMQLSLGLTLAVVFQLAHVVEGTTFPRADGQGVVPGSWAEHQLYTTSNFAMESRWVTALTGGLNHQIEHHLFPKVSHTHYRALGPIVRRVAAEYGLPYHFNETFSSALASHVRTLRRFGAAPAMPVVPAAS